ncbi:hypothetical protein DFH11DRAFT_259670 [Phellopilus nigrolimitatus]|nr:hypothetical protein DFH11DRAFT_259670 [Phellopilus nigrolimitatus]
MACSSNSSNIGSRRHKSNSNNLCRRRKSKPPPSPPPLMRAQPPSRRALSCTVCDRCRKKMKRVGRRGTLDSVSASQQAQMIAHRSSHSGLAHSQSQSTLAHSAGQSQHASVGRARATARQDTLLVNHHTGGAQTQSQLLSPRPVSHYRGARTRPREPSGLEPLALRLAGVCVRLCGGEREAVSCGILASQSGPDVSLGRHKYQCEWTGKPECAQAPADAALYQLHLDTRPSHARTATAVTGGGGTGSRGSKLN